MRQRLTMCQTRAPIGPIPHAPCRRVAVALVAALGAGCASAPAADDPVQLKLNDIDARVTRIERIISNQSLVELAQHLDQVQADVRQFRGRVEELEYNPSPCISSRGICTATSTSGLRPLVVAGRARRRLAR